mmetsp:Transcript_4046/g.5317  ORF Transcript_4046/g.5317 Transcript_4046/m.5317 type:complete len:201 (+) Transcript_4046:93-695(+)
MTSTDGDDSKPKSQSFKEEGEQQQVLAESSSSSGFSKWLNGLPAVNVNLTVHPGHVFLSMAMLSAYSTFRDFKTPLGAIIGSSAVFISPKTGKEEITYTAQSTIASRAFSIGTKGTIATFALCGSMFFYAAGLNSFEKTSSELKRWTRPKKQDTPVVDIVGKTRSHPDFEATKGMTASEEWNYINNKYFRFEENDSEKWD